MCVCVCVCARTCMCVHVRVHVHVCGLICTAQILYMAVLSIKLTVA
jgi:hypothetical protein